MCPPSPHQVAAAANSSVRRQRSDIPIHAGAPRGCSLDLPSTPSVTRDKLSPTPSRAVFTISHRLQNTMSIQIPLIAPSNAVGRYPPRHHQTIRNSLEIPFGNLTAIRDLMSSVLCTCKNWVSRMYPLHDVFFPRFIIHGWTSIRQVATSVH
jgi:hypothetical protein